MNKILVLLASHNGEKFIKKQIDSIFNQKSCIIDLIVSDDCSTDSTLVVLNKLKKQYKKLKIIVNKKKFRNFSENFYHLILSSDASNYDFIAFSDQDDIFKNNKFKLQINEINNKNFSASSCAVKCFQASNRLLYQSPKINKYDFLFEGAGQGCTFIIKKKLFVGLQKFIRENFSKINNFIFHDWLIYIYARSNNYQWCFINEPLVNYRIHNNNQFGNKYTLSGIKKRLIMLQNNWYFEQVNLANEIYKLINQNHIPISQLGFFESLLFSFFYARRKFSDRIIFLLFYFIYRLRIKRI